MFCSKCGSSLEEKDGKIICPKCGVLLDKNEDQPAPEVATPEPTSANPRPAAETALEYIPPRGFSSKKNIIIIILAAVLVLGLGAGITAIAVTNSPSFKTSQGIELAERYLSEQNYEQAIVEYEKVLEIDPKNVDIYLGLAKTYEKMGNIDKVIEILREGYDQTGDNKIKQKLDAMTNPTQSSQSSSSSSPESTSSTSVSSSSSHNESSSAAGSSSSYSSSSVYIGSSSSTLSSSKENDDTPGILPAAFEWLIEPKYKYDDIVMLRDPYFGEFVNTVTLYDNYFDEKTKTIEVGGLYRIVKGDKEGLIDNSGNEIVKPQFDHVYQDFDLLVLSDYSDTNGAYTLNTHYNIVPVSNGHGIDVRIIVLNYYDNKLYGLDLAMDYGYYWKVTNVDTALVLGAYFVPNEDGGYLSNDEMEKILENNSYGYGLYSKGKIVVPTEFDEPSLDDFNSRFVGNSKKDKCVMMKNNKVYIYDITGKCLSDGIYEKEDNYGQEEVYFDGYLTVCRNGKWGLLDEKCNEVVRCQFDDISAVYKGTAWVKMNGKWGLIKIKG